MSAIGRQWWRLIMTIGGIACCHSDATIKGDANKATRGLKKQGPANIARTPWLPGRGVAVSPTGEFRNERYAEVKKLDR
jgi:hypothetical protein